MSVQPNGWRQLFELAQLEKDAQKQKDLCEQARRLIQQRSIALAEAHARDAAEDDEMNAALRELWKLQNPR
jgi:hypothetical protein